MIAQYLPGLQGLHDNDEARSEKVPMGQKEQLTDTAPPAEKEPTGQSPFGALSELVEQYLPAVQDVHADDDAPPLEKEPAWQSPLTAASPPAHHLPALQL